MDAKLLSQFISKHEGGAGNESLKGAHRHVMMLQSVQFHYTPAKQGKLPFDFYRVTNLQPYGVLMSVACICGIHIVLQHRGNL